MISNEQIYEAANEHAKHPIKDKCIIISDTVEMHELYLRKAFIAGVEWALPRWHKMPKELPPIGKPILCYDNSSRNKECYIDVYQGKRENILQFFGGIPSHWMLLPEIPEHKSGETDS